MLCHELVMKHDSHIFTKENKFSLNKLFESPSPQQLSYNV